MGSFIQCPVSGILQKVAVFQRK